MNPVVPININIPAFNPSNFLDVSRSNDVAESSVCQRITACFQCCILFCCRRRRSIAPLPSPVSSVSYSPSSAARSLPASSPCSTGPSSPCERVEGALPGTPLASAVRGVEVAASQVPVFTSAVRGSFADATTTPSIGDSAAGSSGASGTSRAPGETGQVYYASLSIAGDF